jgi:GntR family transcriptional repressor for pyruvate dehydrogenase complex
MSPVESAAKAEDPKAAPGNKQASTAETPPVDERVVYLSPSESVREDGEKLAPQVARAIMHDIVTRDLPDGARLPPEAAMLIKYRVGRPTLREALRILEVNGLVRIKTGPNGGPRVRRSDVRDLGSSLSLHLASRRVRNGDVYNARGELEPLLARLAAERATDLERQSLIDHVRGNTNNDGETPNSWFEFHQLVANLSHDPVLSAVSAALYHICDRSKNVSRAVWVALTAEHLAITEAITAGNGFEAETLMREHMAHYPQLERSGEIVAWRSPRF